jgi:hypothetical protein
MWNQENYVNPLNASHHDMRFWPEVLYLHIDKGLGGCPRTPFLSFRIRHGGPRRRKSIALAAFVREDFSSAFGGLEMTVLGQAPRANKEGFAHGTDKQKQSLADHLQ